MNYPQTVQYCVDPTQHIFAVRVCKSNESRATAFSKAKQDQKSATLACNNKNLKEVVSRLIPDYQSGMRYKITGEYDHENRVMYFDMTTAIQTDYKFNSKPAE